MTQILKDPAKFAADLIGHRMCPRGNEVAMVIEAAKQFKHLPTDYLVAVHHEIEKQLEV